MSNACMNGDLNTVQILIANIKTQEQRFIYDLDLCAVIACKNGHLEIIKWFVDKHYRLELYKIVYHACKTSSFNIVNFIFGIKSHIYPFYTNFGEQFNYSCWKGTCLSANLHMAKLLIKRKIYVERFESLVFYASCGGNYDVVMLVFSCIDGYKLKHGKITFNGRTEYIAHIFNECLRGACISNSVEIFNFAVDNGVSDFNRSMYQACLSNNIEMMELMVDLGYNDWNYILYKACSTNSNLESENNSIEIIKLMVELGANNYNEGLMRACCYGNTEIMKYMVELGANNYNDCLNRACLDGKINAVELIIRLGANDYNAGLVIGYSKNNMNIINLMVCKGATNLNLIKNIYNFRLSCYYSVYIGIEPKLNPKCIELLKRYPVYVLLVGCKPRSINKISNNFWCACIGRKDGKDGKDGKDEKDGKDRKDGKNNYIKKLPNEIFRLLHQYF